MKNKILIVDDEKNIRATLIASLTAMGFEPDTASNGEEALDKLSSGKYTLILLDIKMHGMNGMQVLERLRSKSDRTGVVMMTAYGTIENAVEAMKLGAIDFVTKPFTLEHIKSVVSDAIERQGLVESELSSFKDFIQFAKKCILEKDYDKAKIFLRKAIAENYDSPEPHNLLGIIAEYENDLPTARKHYRAAYDLDPTYRPADENLERISSLKYSKYGINMGIETEKKEK